MVLNSRVKGNILQSVKIQENSYRKKLGLQCLRIVHAVHSYIICVMFVFVDAGYLSSDGHRVHHMTAWIPVLDTNEHNGCMQVNSPSLIHTP